MKDRHRRCLDCDYILDGLHAQRCPECGREFDFNDEKTFTSMKAVRRRIAMHLRWANRLAPWIWVCALVALVFGTIDRAELVQQLAWIAAFAMCSLFLSSVFRAALAARGLLAACVYVTVAVMMTPVLGISLFVVPADPGSRR